MTKLNSILENPLYKFLIWAFVGFCVFCVGIFRVDASTYYYTDFTAKLYDNYGPNLSGVTTNETNNRYQGIIPTMAANSSGGAWGISSPITILANRTYTLTVTIGGTYGGNIVLSSYNRIGVGSSLSSAVTSYENNSNVTENYSRALNDGMTLQFAFTPIINGSYIVFPFATSSSGNNWTFYIESIIIEDLGTSGITQNEINNSLNNQTDIINNTIIENNENTQNSIINNNGASDAITDSLNTCGALYKYTLKKGKKFDAFGNLTDDENFYYTPDYYYLMSATQLTLKGFGVQDAGYIILYDSDYNYIDYWRLTDREINLGTSDVAYYRISTTVPSGLIYEGTCTNKIDETNDKLDDLNDNLTNDNVSGVDSAFDSFNSFLDENSTITQLIILPITLYTSILNNVNGSCIPFNLGSLYGVNLSLPCVNIGSYLGTTLWTMIDIIISGFAVYFISKKLVKIFNNVSSMKEGDVIDD